MFPSFGNICCFDFLEPNIFEILRRFHFNLSMAIKLEPLGKLIKSDTVRQKTLKMTSLTTYSKIAIDKSNLQVKLPLEGILTFVIGCVFDPKITCASHNAL